MWFSGDVHIPRARQYDVKRAGKRVTWNTAIAPYRTSPLTVDPFAFALAAARTSIIGGGRLGLRGQLAGFGLSLAALAYLEKRPGKKLTAHAHFSKTKDFIGKALTGTIGAALCHLEMEALGYVWHGHWEDCTKSSSKTKHPDFVYANTTDVCISDGKGTFNKPDTTAKSGWRAQILPHAKTALTFGGTATKGIVIATGLQYTRSANRSELVIAHGDFGPLPHARALPSAVRSVQRANFIAAFYLLGLNAYASKLANAKAEGEDTAEKTEKNGIQVYLSRPRASFVDSRGDEWIMRVGCRASLVDEVCATLLESNDRQALLEKPDMIGTQNQGESEKTVIRSSLDGLMGIFERL